MEQLRSKIELRLVAMVGRALVQQYGPRYSKPTLIEHLHQLTPSHQCIFSELKDEDNQENCLVHIDETMQQFYSDDVLLRPTKFDPLSYKTAVELWQNELHTLWTQVSVEEMGPALLATRAVVPLPSVTTQPTNDDVVYICPSKFQANSDPLRLITYVLDSYNGRYCHQTKREVALLLDMKEYKFGSSTSAQQSFTLENWIGLVELIQDSEVPMRVSQVFLVETSAEVEHVYSTILQSRSRDGFGTRVNFVSKVEDLGQYMTNPAVWPLELSGGGATKSADLIQDFVTYHTALEQILREELQINRLSPSKNHLKNARNIDSTDEDSMTSSDDDASRLTVVQVPEARKKSRNTATRTRRPVDPPGSRNESSNHSDVSARTMQLSSTTDDERLHIKDRSISPKRVTRRYKLSVETPALQRMEFSTSPYYCDSPRTPTRKLDRRIHLQRGESLPILPNSTTCIGSRGSDEGSRYNESRISHDKAWVPLILDSTTSSRISDSTPLLQSPVKNKIHRRRKGLKKSQSTQMMQSPRVHNLIGKESKEAQISSQSTSVHSSRHREHLSRSQSSPILAPSKTEIKKNANSQWRSQILGDRPNIYRGTSVPGSTWTRSESALEKERSPRAARKQSIDTYNLLYSRPNIFEPGMEILDVTVSTAATSSEANEENIIKEEHSSKTLLRRRFFQWPQKEMKDTNKKHKQGLFSRLFGRGLKTSVSTNAPCAATSKRATNDLNDLNNISTKIDDKHSQVLMDNHIPKSSLNNDATKSSSLLVQNEIVAMAPQKWHARGSIPASPLPRHQRMIGRSSSVQAFPSTTLSTILEDSSARGPSIRPKMKKAKSLRDNVEIPSPTMRLSKPSHDERSTHYATPGDVIITAKPFAPEHTTHRIMATWATSDQLDLPSTDYGTTPSSGVPISKSRRSKMYRSGSRRLAAI